MRTALTIAGSDSGGGAGIQADLKTFAMHGVFGTSAITAITAQNTRGVTAATALPGSVVLAQIEAVLSDLGADAIKIGMLANAEIAGVVADRLAGLTQPIVLDPVMVAKGGSRLIDDAAVGILRTRILPLATVVTANLPEAEALTGRALTSLDAMEQAARAIVGLGATHAMVKGGHLDGPPVDVLADRHGCLRLPGSRIDTVHTHGTGCTLAAAIAARLALGETVWDAAEAAKRYVTWAIRHAPGLGEGHGPLGWGAVNLPAADV